MTGDSAVYQVLKLLVSSPDLAAGILEHLPAGIIMAADLSCKELWHNRKAAEFLRIDFEERSGCRAVWHGAVKIFYRGKEPVPAELPWERAAREGEEIRGLELDFCWEDGVRRSACFNAHPLYDAEGKLRGVFTAFTEITGGRQTEGYQFQSRTAGESRVRLFAPVQENDPAPGDTPSVLPEREERILDLLARQAADLLELRQNYAALEQTVAERTKKLARANKILKKEIKARRRTEKALQESEVKYRLLVENTPDFIYSLDRQGRYLEANQALCRAFGLKEEAITGKNHYELGFPESVVREWEKLHRQVMETGRALQTETTIFMPDGMPRTYWVVLLPVFDARGNVTGITGTSRDITERKKLEQEMLQADKLESISILAGGIAHDFNNYLTTLLGNITLAKLYGYDLPKIREKLDNMEKATLRAQELSNQLFAFAQGGTPVKEMICIRQLLADVVKFCLSGSPVHPCLFIDEELYMVEVEGGQLSQVLSNIVINALQAMPEGGTLEVRAENIVLGTSGRNDLIPLAEGPYVKITIRDEGTGIPAEHLPKIFDPFFTTKEKGRGLGLATSYSIIKRHGGHLSVESEVGVGTSFFLYLPAAARAEKGLADGAKVVPGKGRILLMDDEEDLLAVVGEALFALGYEVALARHGGEALALYLQAAEEKRPFDLVILGLTIAGGMGGKQTITELLRKDPEVKAIVVSGYASDPVMENFRAYGFKAAVQKPFTMETLSELVKEILG